MFKISISLSNTINDNLLNIFNREDNEKKKATTRIARENSITKTTFLSFYPPFL